MFHSWAALLPGLEVIGVQLPGRENRLRESLFRRLEPTVAAAMEALAPALDRPYALLGYSFGALVAYELVRALRREGQALPQRLLVLGRRAPHLPESSPPVYRLGDEQLVAWMREMGGTPQVLLEHPELLPLFLPILRADLTIHETYQYTAEPPLAVPITGFGGVRDPQASREEMEAWRDHSSEGFELRLYPGGHFFWKNYQPMLCADIGRELAVEPE
jgi:medium-chain acyl-[acyl-carrier-protein] hydrolase